MQNTNDTSGFNAEEAADTINIRQELEKYLFHWKWFFLCILISLAGTYIYLRYATPLYSATTTIMIKDNQKSGISKELAAFEDLGIVGGSANNTDNEIEILKSRKIIGAVVDALQLNTIYYSEGRIKTSEVYGNNPIHVVWGASLDGDIYQIEKMPLAINIVSAGIFGLKDAEGNNLGSYSFDEEITANGLRFKIQKTPYFDFKGAEIILVSLLERDKVISGYAAGVKVSAVDKQSSVLKLAFTHPVKQKAEDFLNELVKQYNIDLHIYAVYTGLVYLTPLIGGYLADRFLGTQKSIFIGGLTMMIGHFLNGIS